MASVRAVENNVDPNSSKLTEAVARGLYKLMAYKDEYEVARLYTNGRWLESIKRQFSGNFKVKFHMAPPLLSKRDPYSGQLRKMEFGPWMYHALALLARFRGLRGGRFDIFGYTEERRKERALIGEYRARIEKVMEALKGDNLETAVEIAKVPELIRGYGHVKEGNIELAEQRWSQLEQQFNQPKRPDPEVKTEKRRAVAETV